MATKARCNGLEESGVFVEDITLSTTSQTVPTAPRIAFSDPGHTKLNFQFLHQGGS